MNLPATTDLRAAPAHSLDYLRVRLTGVYAARSTALVRAATDLGTGYWAMTAMRLGDGRTIYVNRGFVPDGTRRDAPALLPPSGPVTVIGLLRSDEPGGSLLQSNRPKDDRWYSRDVQAMAKRYFAGAVLPVFVDVQSPREAGPASPVPGLTVISFPNNHLSYALTWFAMALLSMVALVVIWRRREPCAP